MTKANLIAGLAASFPHIPKSSMARIVDQTFSLIAKSLEETGVFRAPKFGTFEVRRRAQRVVRNPQSHELMTVPERSAIAFSVVDEIRKKCVDWKPHLPKPRANNLPKDRLKTPSSSV